MNQYPPNQPNQPDPYNPNAPTYPYPQYVPPPPPARRQRANQRFLQWYKAKSKGTQAGIGCLLIIGALLVCGACSGLVSAIGSASQASSSPTPTATSAPALAAATATSPAPTATARPTPKPTPRPTPKPQPTQPPAQPTPTPNPCPNAVNGNPWCYDFTAGNYIYSPPADFCSYFACISNFWNGSGFVNECNDGTYSKSGGHRGDCSYHGGEERPLYSH